MRVRTGEKLNEFLLPLEQHLTPEMFAELLCEDLALDPSKFVKPISESIRTQVIDFEAIYEYELPSNGNQRVEINVR